MGGTLTCSFGTPELKENNRYTLASVVFGTAPTVPTSALGGIGAGVETGVHLAHSGADALVESWFTSAPVRSGGKGPLVYAEDGEYLFCAARIPKQPVYQDIVYLLYTSAFELIARLGYDRIFRMWNFVGQITGTNSEEQLLDDYLSGDRRRAQQ